MASADAVSRASRSTEAETIRLLKLAHYHGVPVGDRRLVPVSTLAREMRKARDAVLDKRATIGRNLLRLAREGAVGCIQLPVQIRQDDFTPAMAAGWPAYLILREGGEFIARTEMMPNVIFGADERGALTEAPLVPQLVNATMAHATAEYGRDSIFGFAATLKRNFTEVSVDAFAREAGPASLATARAFANVFEEGLGPSSASVRMVDETPIDEDVAFEIIARPAAYSEPTPSRRVGGSFDPRSAEMFQPHEGFRVLSRQPIADEDRAPEDACAITVRVHPYTVIERLLEHGTAGRFGGS